jgi:hypothetical protein
MFSSLFYIKNLPIMNYSSKPSFETFYGAKLTEKDHIFGKLMDFA